MKVLLTGGGTGGHAFPVLAVAIEIAKIDSNIEFLWIGTRKGIEKKLAINIQIPFKSISAGKLRRYFSFKNVVDFFKFIIGIFQSFFIVLAFKPDVLYSKGGYVGAPVVIAAGLLRKKIITHESDIVPGLANRTSSRFANIIAISFEATRDAFPGKQTVFTGNPIRTELTKGTKQAGLDFFNLNSERPIIFVMGGSQGARGINNLVIEALPSLLKKVQIIHQTGEVDFQEVKKQTKKYFPKGYRIFPFIQSELKDAYAAADLIIGRSGGSIFEILANGKPSILIPLPTSAGNHQVKNAFELKSHDAAVVLDQNKTTASSFHDKIIELIEDKDRLQELSKNALKLSRPDAALNIAKEVISLGKSDKEK